MNKIIFLIVLCLGLTGCQSNYLTKLHYQDQVENCITAINEQHDFKRIQGILGISKKHVQIKKITSEPIDMNAFTLYPGAEPHLTPDLLITIGKTEPSKKQLTCYLEFLYHLESDQIVYFRLLENGTDAPPFTDLTPHETAIQICLDKIASLEEKNPILQTHLNKNNIIVEPFVVQIYYNNANYYWFDLFNASSRPDPYSLLIIIGNREPNGNSDSVYIEFLYDTLYRPINAIRMVSTETGEELELKLSEGWIEYQ